MAIEPLERLTGEERGSVEAEGSRLLAFLARDAARRDVRMARPIGGAGA
jgi:hypothetical protein